MRAPWAILDRFGIPLLVLGTLIVAAVVGGVFGNTEHTGVTTPADNVRAPTVMVHADHPTVAGTFCGRHIADRGLRTCHGRRRG